MKILIVDDTPSNLHVLRAVLEGQDFEVFEAANGLEALALLERQPVDAIISDLSMPGMDGYRFCQEVRRHDRFRHLPFIAYTSVYNSPEDAQLALAMGADKYMQKPAPIRDLTDALNELVQRGYLVRPLELPPQPALARARGSSQTLAQKLEQKRRELTAQQGRFRHSRESLRQLAESITEIVWRDAAQSQSDAGPLNAVSSVIAPARTIGLSYENSDC